MLDNEPTGADGDQTRGAAEQNLPAETPARSTRRRRTATTAAGDPALPTGAPPTDSAAGPAAQPDPATDQPAQSGPGGRSGTGRRSAAAGTDAGAAPAKAPRKRTPRKATAAAAEVAAEASAAPPAAASVQAAEPLAAAPGAASAEAGESPAPAKRTRARRSARAATGSAPGADLADAAARAATSADGAADVAAAVDAAVVAEAGEPAPAKRTRSRRVAKAPAGSPAHVESVEPTMALPAGADVPPDVAAPAVEPAPEATTAVRRRRSRATKVADRPGEIADTHAADAAGAPAGAALAAAGAGTAAGGDETTEPPVTDESIRPSSASPFTDAPAEPTRRTRRRATAPETSPPPAAVMFVAPTETEAAGPRRRTRAAEEPDQPAEVEETPAETQPRRRRRTRAADEQPVPEPEETQPRRRRRTRAADEQPVPEPEETQPEETDEPEDVGAEDADGGADRRRRRRGRRGRGRSRTNGEAEEGEEAADEAAEQRSTDESDAEDADETAEDGDRPSSRRRRRRRRRGGGGADTEQTADDDPPDTVVHVRDSGGRQAKAGTDDEVRGVRGSTRLEAKRQRRREGRDTGRRRPPILSEAEFLARREAVDRVMVVRQRGDRTQIAVLEDDILVEHYVTKASSTSYAGNVYLGRVQNVLPSMEAAFVDIGKGRNAVLYAGEVNWDATGLEGRARSIEHALKSGDNIVVQVTKDPIGHKGARLTSQISLPGRYLVYVPNGSMTGISRKLPDTERARLKDILRRIVPDDAGVIIRTAAEGASEEELTRDVERLKAQWESIQRKAGQTKSAPTLLYAEPDLELRVVRDVFNEDFTRLVVSGDDAWQMISQYVDHVAPDLLPRLEKWTGEGDAFHDLRIDEQLLKGLDRKVWLPSGGSLVIDRTEAMTVIDVNTGKFVGQGGNLEQTVTRNNLEAAEEIVRQLRLRDIGGIIVIDFIDMVLESNRDLVLRRLTECLGRDRTKHQVAEVTSLGLVQMTRKRVGQGLLEAFSEPCPTCGGRGLLVHTEPVDDSHKKAAEPASRTGRRGRRAAAAEAGPPTPALIAARGSQATPDEVDVASEDHRAADEAVDTIEAVEPEADVTVRPEGEPAAAASAGIGELPPAVPDPNAGAPNAPEPVPDPDAPTPPAETPAAGGGRRRGRRRAEAAAGSPPPIDATPPDSIGSGPLESVGAGPAESAGAGPLESVGAAPPDSIGAGPLESVGAGPVAGNGETPAAATRRESPDDGSSPATRWGSPDGGTGEATRPESPDGGTAPDGSEPVAGSNGVVAPGTDTAEFPSAPEPVAGSNGAVGADGGGSAPRRRRRTASRPAGPPQPVSGE